jgi:myo-inositol-1(or 4)-monophosphatase
LDGTTNFLRGIPQYCVSIALTVKGQITQGVIFDPLKNELFTASRGNGAYLNDRRIRVTPTRLLSDSLIGTGFPFKEINNFDAYLRAFGEMTRRTAGIRRPGAAALDLAYVACGRYDGFWEQGLSEWDMAAGALMVREAGGIVTDYDGSDRYLDTGAIVAATPKIYAEFLEVVTGKRGQL